MARERGANTLRSEPLIQDTPQPRGPVASAIEHCDIREVRQTHPFRPSGRIA